MKQKKLRPIIDRPHYWEQIDALIKSHLIKEIFAPLLSILIPPKNRKNSIDDLAKALAEGMIFYVDGYFEGKFDSKISRELKKLGAIYSKKNKHWIIPRNELPLDVLMAISIGKTKFEEKIQSVLKKLNEIDPDKSIELERQIKESVTKVHRDINSSLQAIKVQVKLTDAERERIAKEYTENLNLYIKRWKREEILKLREKIQSQTLLGLRRESLITTIHDIKSRAKVSETKARFLARQETNLLTAALIQDNLKQAGVKKYLWKCVSGSKDHPVRPRHKELNDMSQNDGVSFSWDNPPRVSEEGETIRYGHPKQDFNCRCYAIPIVEFEK